MRTETREQKTVAGPSERVKAVADALGVSTSVLKMVKSSCGDS